MEVVTWIDCLWVYTPPVLFINFELISIESLDVFLHRQSSPYRMAHSLYFNNCDSYPRMWLNEWKFLIQAHDGERKRKIRRPSLTKSIEFLRYHVRRVAVCFYS